VAMPSHHTNGTMMVVDVALTATLSAPPALHGPRAQRWVVRCIEGPCDQWRDAVVSPDVDGR
jgi:hypothetical protein